MPHLLRRGVALALLALASVALAGSSTKVCSHVATSTNWTNPNNALDSDTTDYAVYSAGTQDLLTIDTCAFAIPDGAKITGVQVHRIGCGTGTSAARRRIRLNLTGAGTCTAKIDLDQAACTGWTDVQEPTATNDTWSCTLLDPSHVNATAFGVTVTDNDTTSGSYELRIAFAAEVTVYYSTKKRYMQSYDDDLLPRFRAQVEELREAIR